MTVEQMEQMKKLAQEHDLDVSFRDRYSGRGMFGKTTCAVEGNLVDLYFLMKSLKVGLRTDQMGKDHIIY